MTISDQLESLAVPVDSLHTMPGNPRKGDVTAVKRSYEQFGQRKPIVALRDGTVIAGNHQLLAARELGWEKIAVVYVDDDPKTAKAFALADNRTSDLGTYDSGALAEMLSDVAVDSDLLLASGYTQADLDALISGVFGEEIVDRDNDPKYTMAVNAPQYNIVGDEPEIDELFDTTRAEDLRAEIEASDIPEEIAEFLIAASYRHVVFNYRKIAEFYPHMSAEVQKLMEDSALVIIDYEDAMRNGYVRLAAALEALREQDADA
jgi:hypothetical protein